MINTSQQIPDANEAPQLSPTMSLVRETYDHLAHYFEKGGNWLWLRSSVLNHLRNCKNTYANVDGHPVPVIPANPIIIDIGSGISNNAPELVKALGGKYIGIEFSEEMVRRAHQNVDPLEERGTLIAANFRDAEAVKNLAGNGEVLLDIGAADGATMWQHMRDVCRLGRDGSFYFGVIFDKDNDVENTFLNEHTDLRLKTRASIALNNLVVTPASTSAIEINEIPVLKDTQARQQIPPFKLNFAEMTWLFSKPSSNLSGIMDVLRLGADQEFNTFNRSVLRPTSQEVERFIAVTGAKKYKPKRGPFRPYFISATITNEMIQFVNSMAELDDEALASAS